MMTNMLIIIIGLLVYNYYSFLLYTTFHSSPVEHENLKSKVVLMGTQLNFFKINFLKCAKKIRVNVVSIFQNHDLLVKENSISNKWKKFILQHLYNIYLIWDRYVYPTFHGNVRIPR